MPNMSLIGNICNFELGLSLMEVRNWYERSQNFTSFDVLRSSCALSYWTGSIPKLMCLIWVWSETFAILSWVWVWSTTKTGMRGVKIWHRSMFSDPAAALSYQTGSIPWSMCLIWVWSETFLILSWVWFWLTSETGMRGFKIWHHSMFSEPAVNSIQGDSKQHSPNKHQDEGGRSLQPSKEKATNPGYRNGGQGLQNMALPLRQTYGISWSNTQEISHRNVLQTKHPYTGGLKEAQELLPGPSLGGETSLH